jgi:hypothetical protein
MLGKPFDEAERLGDRARRKSSSESVVPARAA